LINEYASRLVPQGCRDDVWLGTSTTANRFYEQYNAALINGGSLFDGEEGLILSNVFRAVNGSTSYDNYWIDAGRDGVLQPAVGCADLSG
jgi:hypothetical protein